MRTWIALVLACSCHPPVEPASPSPAPEPAPVESEWTLKQRAFSAQFADELAAYHALEPRLASADVTVTEEADALRARFVKRCISETHLSSVACWNGTFARDLTEALAKIRHNQGDKVLAYLEQDALGEYPDLRSEDAQHRFAMGYDIRTAEGDAARKEAEVLFRGLRGSRAELQSINRSKTTATLHFASVESSSVGYACGDEEVVVVEDRDSASGKKLATRQKCKVSQVETSTASFAAVTVPIDEARDLKVGQAVLALAPKGKPTGHVAMVWTNNHDDHNEIFYRSLPVKASESGNP